MKKLMAILIVLSLFLTATAIGQTINYDSKNFDTIYFASEEKSSWTVMYYMCCDSNMYEDSDELIENLSKIGSKQDFNLIALYDGIYYGDSKVIYFDYSGEQVILNNQIGFPDEIDYSNPIVFEEFLKKTIQLFPAEHYAFITYGSAGLGWQIYCVHDESNGTTGFSIPRLGEAFKNVTNNGEEKIDVIFTSCAMNAVELAYEIYPYVDYIVGTQDCLSSNFYYRFYQPVWSLYNNTDLKPEEFAKLAPEQLKPKSFFYRESYYGRLFCINKFLNKLPFKNLHTVVHHDNTGVVNCSNIKSLIKSVDNLSRYLTLNLYDKEILNNIKDARAEVRESGKCNLKYHILPIIYIQMYLSLELFAYDAFIDLYDFCEKLKGNTENIFLKDHCLDVMQNMNKSVPYINTTTNDSLHGLNIYFPEEKRMYNMDLITGPLPCTYECLKFSKDTSWDEFIKDYLKV